MSIFSTIPKNPHYAIILKKIISNSYDNLEEPNELCDYIWYTDKTKWEKDIEKLALSGTAFQAIQAIPAKVSIKIETETLSDLKHF